MAKKQMQKLVVGNWVDLAADGEPERVAFVPLEKQPDECITEVGKMVAWAKEALKDSAGSYDFVRDIPGQLTIAVQTVMTFDQPAAAEE